MKIQNTLRAGLAIASLLAATAWADTLVLRDGTVYHGELLSASQNRVVFDSDNSGTREFSSYDVESITLGEEGTVTNEVMPMAQRARARDQIMREFMADGGSDGILGTPVSRMVPTRDNRGEMREYQNGVIYWTPLTGAHAVSGAIRDEYMRRGGPEALGYPTSSAIPNPNGDGSQIQYFEHGTIRAGR
jgi:LGFP repeat